MHIETGDPLGKSDVEMKAERRRAGRLDEVSPTLVPLLRGEFEAELPPEPEAATEMEPPAADGPIIGRELALGIWVAVALMVIGVVLRFAV